VLTKYSAHREVRQMLAWLLLLTGIWALGCLVASVFAIPAAEGWILLAAGIVLASITLGIWYAKEWARLAAAGISFGWAVCLLSILIRDVSGAKFASLTGLVPIAYLGFLAWYSSRAATKRLFAEAREAITRARAVTS